MSALTSRESTSSSRESLGTICLSWQVGPALFDHLLLSLENGKRHEAKDRCEEFMRTYRKRKKKRAERCCNPLEVGS